MDSRLLLQGADISRGQVRERLFRKPALRLRLRRLTCLIVIGLVFIRLWVAAIWTAILSSALTFSIAVR